MSAPATILGLTIRDIIMWGVPIAVVMTVILTLLQHPQLLGTGGLIRKIIAATALTVVSTVAVSGALGSIAGLVPYIDAPQQPPKPEKPGEETGIAPLPSGQIIPPNQPPPGTTLVSHSDQVATNCLQYTLFNPDTGRLNLGYLEACVSQITNCATFTANLCHRYPDGAPAADGYGTCISYIWKRMDAAEQSSFRTAIATQPLCSSTFHSILN